MGLHELDGKGVWVKDTVIVSVDAGSIFKTHLRWPGFNALWTWARRTLAAGVWATGSSVESCSRTVYACTLLIA